MCQIGVRAVWKNFCYSFVGKTYQQQSGGPLGTRITMAVSRLVMNNWGKQYRSTLTQCGLMIFQFDLYVDDIRQTMNALLKGMRYNLETKIIEMSEEGRTEDIKLSSEGETATQRMARVCNPIMNSINPDLKFTTEVPEDFPDGRLPSLDFTI